MRWNQCPGPLVATLQTEVYKMRSFLRYRGVRLAIIGVLGCFVMVAQAADPVLSVSATVETEPVPHSGDAADDPAIWVHPTNPEQSLIFGTDKKGGLAVYDLAGKQRQYLADGKLNNVDLRPGFLLNGQSTTIVTAGNRSNNSIAIYRVNEETRELENVAAHIITTQVSYGSCMYHSAQTNTVYYIVTSKTGGVEQWELFEAADAGRVDARKVREFDVGSQIEGCVADDDLGHLYIGEETVGIWKYGAEPDAGTTRTQVDTTGADGHLAADVEGLTIAHTGDGTGYLIASSQGNRRFVVYRREESNSFVTAFKIQNGASIDRVSGTDGIDVTTASLGPGFPCGAFVAQDGKNGTSNQNFKIVPWEQIIPC
jgi:3-phytase